MTGIKQYPQRFQRSAGRREDGELKQIKVCAGQSPVPVRDGTVGRRIEPDNGAVHFGFAPSRIKANYVLSVGEAERFAVPQIIRHAERTLNMRERTPLGRDAGCVAAHDEGRSKKQQE
mgnify:CR=1 FL=1